MLITNSLVTCPALPPHWRPEDQVELVNSDSVSWQERYLFNFLGKGTPTHQVFRMTEKSPSSSLSWRNGLWVLPVPGKQKCKALFSSVVPPSCTEMPTVLTFLDSSGVGDQYWRPEVRWKERSTAALSTENYYKALFACAVNYIFILLAWDRWIFPHTKVPC